MAGNPFSYSGPLDPADMINRDDEAGELYEDLAGGHWVRLSGPRRYGKTTLFKRVLAQAEDAGFATTHVDLEGVNTLAGVVVRIERAYDKSLKGKLRRTVEELLKSWGLGVSLGAGGFSLRIQVSPDAEVEGVLLRVLSLPQEVERRTGKRSMIVFDEVQDLLRVERADGILRSVIQHQGGVASYAFAGSAPSMMEQLFSDPRRPLLEQAVPYGLAPLNQGDVARYIAERFERSGRDAGRALSPLVEFTRGHPQRSMLLAHHLWRRTGAGGDADEGTWASALEAVIERSSETLEANWRLLNVNEQKLALALATGAPSLYDGPTLARVGLKKGSVRKALSGLRGRGDVVGDPSHPRLTDPLLEQWLARRAIA